LLCDSKVQSDILGATSSTCACCSSCSR